MLRQSAASKSLKLLVVVWAGLGLLLAACSPSIARVATAMAPGASSVPPTAPPTQAESSATPGESADPTEAPSSTTEGQLRLVLAPDGNEARYRVREQLANVSLPSDAVGVTSAITGMIVINADGTVVSDESEFVVDLTTLKSDQNRRDNFIKGNTLETNRYPTAEFVPAEALGLPSPLPTSGEVTFQLVGDLTVHGVTKQVTWDVTAEAVNGRELAGSATTSFAFGDFGMTSPRVPVVLSVEETIRLEFDFHLVLES